MSAAAETTALGQVVAVHEYAKAILGDSYHVNLRALDAMVRSIRGGARLRGFAEVSSQMRQWSRELHSAVQRVTTLSADQVGSVSAFVKRRRMTQLLAAAAHDPSASAALAPALKRADIEVELAREGLRRERRKVRNALEELEQLGLMARVLSSVAEIEAAAGDAQERSELTIVCQEFAERSEKVSENVRYMMATDREARP